MEKSVSESEMQIMKLVWQNGGAIGSAELSAALCEMGTDWKRSTISTFISRLCEKRMLKSQKQGRAYCYTALVSQSKYRSFQTGEFVDKLFGGSAKGLVAALLEDSRLSKEDIAELKTYLNSEESKDEQ